MFTVRSCKKVINRTYLFEELVGFIGKYTVKLYLSNSIPNTLFLISIRFSIDSSIMSLLLSTTTIL